MIKHSCKDAGRSVAEPFDKVGRYGRDAQEKKNLDTRYWLQDISFLNNYFNLSVKFLKPKINAYF